MDKIKVMACDDSRDVTNLIKERVSKEDDMYVIDVAQDGKECLEKISLHSKVDVLVLDLIMPNLDGFGVLKEIKFKYKNNVDKVICISALVNPNLLTYLTSLGADLFIVKPFDINALIEMIRDISSS